jgi:hypothetical protein
LKIQKGQSESVYTRTQQNGQKKKYKRPIGLFFFSVIGLGIIETLVDFSGLLIRSLADILQFRFGPCSNKIGNE